MRSKSLLAVLWLIGTAVAATIAWQSLGLVTASTDGDGVIASRSTTSDPTIGSSTSGDPDEPTPVTRPEPGPSTTSVTTRSDGASVSSSGTAAAAGAIEQTFDLIGGRAAISFSASEVKVLWAIPADGYTVDSHPEDGGVEVEFRNGQLRSKLEAWWADGPRSDIRERDD